MRKAQILAILKISKFMSVAESNICLPVRAPNWHILACLAFHSIITIMIALKYLKFWQISKSNSQVGRKIRDGRLYDPKLANFASSSAIILQIALKM